jgi:RNA polymerase sigma-70 factor, ECF subfamily
MEQTEVILNYYEKICSLATSFLGNADDARKTTLDVLSTATVVAERRGADFPVSDWLYRNCIRTCLRKTGAAASVRPAALDDCMPVFSAEGRHAIPLDDWTGTVERIPRSRVRETVRRFIGDLPEKSRVAVILVDVEGLSVVDAGRILGLPVPAVILHLHKARLCLREKLARYTRVGHEPA